MWNERYATDEYFYGEQPNDWLVENHKIWPQPSDILCIAEGEGRNAVFLAKAGHRVTAMDASLEGIRKGKLLAQKHNTQVEWIHADLDQWPLGTAKWDGIVAIFAHLPPALRQKTLAQIYGALKPEGWHLCEYYAPGQEMRTTGGPKDRSWLVDPACLDQECGPDWHLHTNRVIEREVLEGIGHTGLALVCQRLAQKTAPN